MFSHGVLFCVSLSKFPLSHKDNGYWIRVHPHPAWPHFNLQSRYFQIRSTSTSDFAIQIINFLTEYITSWSIWRNHYPCESKSCSVVSDSLQPHGLYSPWNSPGQNTGAGGSYSLLQGIFPTQRWNPGLPHCRRILYYLSHQGSPVVKWEDVISELSRLPEMSVG